MKKMILVCLLIASSFCIGHGRELGVEDIVRKNLATTKGFKDSYEKLEMVLRTDDGKEARRNMVMRSLEVTGDGDKSLIVFQDPADVKGSSVLTHSHIKDDDDQWIYLPALKRVKRISSSNKSGSFMGSEIAYEDLSSNEYEKFSYTLLEKKTEDGVSYYLVEKTPQYKNSGYSKLVDYIRADNFVTDKSIRYDENGKLYKTLRFIDYKKYPNGVWKMKKIEFSNHINKKSTDLVWKEDVKFSNGFSHRDFEKNVLKRMN